ncbi:GerAB/ArcD/ProY family transporter [Guptibacillus algicola]|uniref:GerAB/ArcD/ProY family transporter n=1 Tax=Guptibacillus algicola TaxID=225844 RepID=UPI001CD256BB|nr:endospore germination permease [Alkalihalobacillus algicola]MCA0988360.1 spore germination protein [Alkalihalobacillus algicola]
MPNFKNNTITLTQFSLLLYGTQSGIGILSLPRDLAEIGDTSSWIALFIGYGLSVLASILIVQVMKNYPGDTIIQLFKRFFGKWLGSFLSVCWIVYTTFGMFLITVTTIFIINTWVLPKTAPYLILLIITIPSFYLARNGLRIISRFSVLVFLFTSWMAILFMYPMFTGNLLHLLPIIKDGIMPILKSVPNITFSFLGIELLFIIYPFLEDKSKAVKGILIANGITLLSYLVVTFSSFIYYGPYEVVEYVWPTLNLVKPIEFPFLERFEIIFLSFYLLILATTGIPYYFASSFSIAQLLGRKDHQLALLFLLPVVYISFFFFTNSLTNLDKLGNIFNKVGLGIAFILPVLLLFYGWVFRLFRREKT